VPGPVPDDVGVLLVDLDGTLVDTNYLHTVAWALALEDVGVPVPPMAVVHHLIGMGAEELVGRLLGAADDDVAAAHDRRFAEFLPSVRPLPGAADFLARAAASARSVVLVTSSDEQLTGRLLAPLGGTEVVDDIVHGGMVGRTKPHPEPYLTALERAGVPPDAALAVGDSEWDVRSAAAAGVPCLGLETGGTDRVTLYGAGARDVFADLEQLVQAWEVFEPSVPVD
jgi:HAD superfamily hydrolase (TIGR01509 family)